MFPKPQKKKKKTRPGFDTPANIYCQYCGSTYGVERHHITAKGIGGSWDPKIHSEENRIDLCFICHDRAQQYKEGYKPKDLMQKKDADEKRRRLFEQITRGKNAPE